MSDSRKIAVFAESGGARHFLAEIVRLLGYETASEGADLPSLRQQGAKLQVSVAGEHEIAFLTLPQKASALASAIRGRLEKQAAGKREIVIGAYTLDTYNHILSGEPGETRLTEKESAILSCLHRAGGSIVARQTLLDEVWGYAQNVETHTLETHIYRLRQKIESDPSSPQILKTEDEGYSLVL